MSAPLATIFAEANVELLALLVVVVAVVSSALVKLFRGRAVAGGTRVTRPRTATPTPFSYWYAQVTFEHDDGAKERPVLVLRVEGVNARVLKVTSKPKCGKTNWRRVDTSVWDRPGQREGSWLQQPTNLARVGRAEATHLPNREFDQRTAGVKQAQVLRVV
jgi:hypothetical protein